MEAAWLSLVKGQPGRFFIQIATPPIMAGNASCSENEDRSGLAVWIF
jgi:hypothetical protein